MKILITGGHGFAGKHLRRHYDQAGRDHTVRSYDFTRMGDIRDYEQLRTEIDTFHPDAIYHLAAQAYVPEATTDPHRAIAINICGTLNLLDAIRNTGCRPRLLITSTSGVYGYDNHDGPINEDTPTRPTDMYGVTKLAAEHAAVVYGQQYGFEVIVTRAFNHTGPGRPPQYADSAFAKKIAEVELGLRTEITHGDLTAVRNYSDVRDIVRGYAALMRYASPGVYNVGSSYTVSMQTIMDLLCEASTAEIKTRVDPSLYRRPDPHHLVQPDFRKFHRAVGYDPETPTAWLWYPQYTLDATLRDLLEWWRIELASQQPSA